MKISPPSAIRKIWLAIIIAWRRMCDAVLPRDYQKKHEKNFEFLEVRSRRAAKIAAFFLFMGSTFSSYFLVLSFKPVWGVVPDLWRSGGWQSVFTGILQLNAEILVWQALASCIAFFLFALAHGVWEHRFWAFRVGFYLFGALSAFSLLIFMATENKSTWIWTILLYNFLTLHSLWQVERTTESWH